VGALLGSLTAGLLGAIVTLVAGTFYHRLVEEKELELRFGQDYISYKAETPYLRPRLPRGGRISPPPE
jgi:protein-S-isoprenylcysteine O-methyltransferase Ste14